MNETLRNLWSRITPILDRYSKTQKRNILIALIAAILCLIVILWVVMRPHYVTVMSGLDDKSLGQVDQQLKALKISDRIQGNSVEVPASQADTARVQLAMNGLPKSGYIGYSSVQNSFGMTQDQFNVQVLDALQQSLNQTIESIDGIQSAQVHIVMPQQQLFVSQPESDAKASVFIQVGPGVQLSSAQVAGIRQLVAHAVNGLSPSNVTVVDQNGVSLSDQPQTAASGAGATSELSLRQQMEQQLSTQINNQLSQILGPGNAVVTVHANVTFDQISTKSHVVQPQPGTGKGVPTSESSVKKSSTSSSGSAAGGAAGQSSTNPGLPSYSGTGGGAGSSTSSETDLTTNYDNSTTDSNTVADPIQIKGYTVGVLLNSQNKALNTAVVSQIKDFVSKAVGAQAGTSAVSDITVAAVPFQQVVPTGLNASKSNLLLWGGIAAAAALIGGLMLYRSRRRKQALAGVDDPLPMTAVAELENTPLSEDERMKEDLARMATKKPDEFVNLLRTWLANE